MSTHGNGIWRADISLDQLRVHAQDTLVSHLGIELTEMGVDFLRGTMPVDSRTCQPMRILHGGASVVLAESLASIAANAVIDSTRFACVGQEINANHIRPVSTGNIVTGTTRPVHLGARSQVWSIEIVNDRGQLVCVSRITMAMISYAKAAD